MSEVEGSQIVETVLLSGVLEPAGSSARTIDDLWWIMAVLGGAVFVVVAVALTVGLRRGGTTEHPTEDPRREPSARRGTALRWIIGGGVILPTAVIAVVLAATIWSMRAVSADRSDPDLTVEVVGHQWWWEVRYPDSGVVTANEVHIPAGRSVDLRLRSADVIHSFWVPELAGKMDLLPERENRLRIDADRPGRYAGRCAEFCGIQHAKMDLVVVAHDDAGFRTWLAEQSAPAAPPTSGTALKGADVFVDRGCASCHAIAGTEADGDDGPDLTHVWSRDRMAAGALETSARNLESWIRDPHAIKEGVLMPSVELTDDEIDALVAYVETLR